MTKLILPPPGILRNPARVDKWVYNLTAAERGVYSRYLNELVKRLSPQKKSEVMKRFYALQSSSIGLGYLDALIGAAGALTGALVTTGASIYMQQESNELNKILSSQGQMTSLVGQQISSDADSAVKKILADAQIEAARIAAGAQMGTAVEMANATVEQARINALRDVTISSGQQAARIQVAQSTWGQWGKWATIGGLGLVSLVVVGGVVRKRKRRKAISA